MPTDYYLLGTKVSVTDIDKASRDIIDNITKGFKGYVCVAPASTIVECYKDPSLKDIINKSFITTPDGMPLVWIGKLKGHKSINRTYGPDLMLKLCEKGQDIRIKHFFYGGREDSVRKLIYGLKGKFADLEVAGYYSPPFRDIHYREEKNIIDQINNSGADILWVGIGSPKQEYWMHEHRGLINVPIMIGSGAAFDFLSGAKKQAPLWMQRSGLEWLFRLISEPGRLWKRYLIGNTMFILLVIKEFFSSLFSKDKYNGT
jgi:N-acetylglucosaminyldiphosphoundecaprenol N-acetyl-beta-D-mannosaminyltransferase